MKFLSLFSGIDSASIAWRDLGYTCVGFSEIEPFACSVLKQRYPRVKNFGNISNISNEDLFNLKSRYGKIDIVIGGSPCQSFSYAGQRLGVKDERGKLMFEYARVIEQVRPTWIVWENVTGVLTSNNGTDFGCLLRILAELGYSLAWRTLNAKFYGIPQQRRRVFLVGHIGKSTNPYKVLFNEKSVTRNSEKIKKSKKENTKNLIHGIRQKIKIYRENDFPSYCESNFFATLRVGSNDSNLILEKDTNKVRRLTPEECERLQGFPTGFTNIQWNKSKNAPAIYRYKVLGNTICVPVLKEIGARIKELK